MGQTVGGLSWEPFASHLENVKANAPEFVDVRVVNLGQEADLRGHRTQ